MKTLEIVSDYLDTYSGRDKFLRTLSYAAKLATCFSKSDEVNGKLNRFSSRMSECRVMLRLLDDILHLHHALNYGWGRQEPDGIDRCLELIEIYVGLVYSPIETICWAGENNLVSIDVEKWGNASTYFWIFSLCLSWMKASRKYNHLSMQKKFFLRTLPSTNASIQEINGLMLEKKFVCIRMIMDLIFAIHYLPKGRLWGGKLSTWHVGALGTVSSLIGLYQALSEKSAKF